MLLVVVVVNVRKEMMKNDKSVRIRRMRKKKNLK